MKGQGDVHKYISNLTNAGLDGTRRLCLDSVALTNKNTPFASLAP